MTRPVTLPSTSTTTVEVQAGADVDLGSSDGPRVVRIVGDGAGRAEVSTGGYVWGHVGFGDGLPSPSLPLPAGGGGYVVRVYVRTPRDATAFTHRLVIVVEDSA